MKDGAKLGQIAFANDKGIILEGDWSVARAAELHRFLSCRLDELLQKEPAPLQAELNLAAVLEVDACGCQLLALFLEELRRHGIVPIPCAMTAATREKITLLGFSELLAAHEQRPRQ